MSLAGEPQHVRLQAMGNRLMLKPLLCMLVCCVVLLATVEAQAVRVELEPPGAKEFILDKAEVLPEEVEQSLREQCAALLAEKATPIIIVTINSMADHGGEDMRIETFARLLFDQWQIGHAEINEQVWNTGILVLVSPGDRKARIELGAGWGREKDQLCREIMDERMVPRFRVEDYAGGITAGVAALDAMARGKEMPTVPRPWWHYGLVALAIGLGIFTIVSLVRNGSSGWAWLLWGAVFAVVGYLLYHMLTSSGRSSGGGGFSGGSFGGGFSGGGGATGSW